MIDLPDNYTIVKIFKEDLSSNVFIFLINNEKQTKVIKSIDIEKSNFHSNYFTHLIHQNIVKCFEVYKSKGRINYLLEYCDGKNLSLLISNINDLRGFLLPISCQLLNGINYLHSNNVIHGDLKSENIILVEDSTGNFSLKLLDYNNEMNVNINDGDVCATPEYSSPQQLNGEFSKSSDIWSIGCILFEIASKGKLPFGKRGDVGLKKVIYNVKNNSIPQESLRFQYPFNYIIYKCLRKKEIDRFKNCSEIICILKNSHSIIGKIKHYFQMFAGIIFGEIK